MSLRANAGKSLVNFTDDVGIPASLVHDGTGEFTGKHKEFMKEARKMHIRTWNKVRRTRIMQPNEKFEYLHSIGSCKCRRRRFQSIFGILVLCKRVNCLQGWHDVMIIAQGMKR